MLSYNCSRNLSLHFTTEWVTGRNIPQIIQNIHCGHNWFGTEFYFYILHSHWSLFLVLRSSVPWANDYGAVVTNVTIMSLMPRIIIENNKRCRLKENPKKGETVFGACTNNHNNQTKYLNTAVLQHCSMCPCSCSEVWIGCVHISH